MLLIIFLAQVVRARWGRINWFHGNSEKFQVWKNWCRSCLLYQSCNVYTELSENYQCSKSHLQSDHGIMNLKEFYGWLEKICSSCQQRFYFQWWKHLVKMCYETRNRHCCIYFWIFIRNPLCIQYLSVGFICFAYFLLFSIPLFQLSLTCTQSASG